MSKPDVPRGERGKWLPGVSPNPSGRPANEFSIRAFVKAKATHDAPIIYESVFKAAVEGDVRAADLYSKWLDKSTKDIIPNPFKDSNDVKNTNELLQHLIQSLIAFEGFTFEQVITLMSTANNIKMTENVEKETLASKLSDEKISAIMNLIQEDKQSE